MCCEIVKMKTGCIIVLIFCWSSNIYSLFFRPMDRNYRRHLSGVRNTKEPITLKSSLKHGTHIIMYSDVYLNSYQW